MNLVQPPRHKGIRPPAGSKNEPGADCSTPGSGTLRSQRPVCQHDQEIAHVDDTTAIDIDSVAAVVCIIAVLVPAADQEHQVVDVHDAVDVEVADDAAIGQIDAERLVADVTVAELNIHVDAHGGALRGTVKHGVK
jgi:hypothetical protein